MTEVPEYLLRRSKERREALGLAPSGGAAPADSGAAPAADVAPGAPVAATAAPETTAAPTPAVPTVAEPSVPATVAVAERRLRSGVPYWMMPVIAILPLWAFLYLGSFGTRGDVAETPAQMGARVYQTQCSGCHGATGGGGSGPKLAGGEAALTFPQVADHVAWVETGSGPKKGQPYGDPGRGKIATSGGMPGFKGKLSDAEIQAVVTYEREGL